jgi:hypothetical protein
MSGTLVISEANMRVMEPRRNNPIESKKREDNIRYGAQASVGIVTIPVHNSNPTKVFYASEPVSASMVGVLSFFRRPLFNMYCVGQPQIKILTLEKCFGRERTPRMESDPSRKSGNVKRSPSGKSPQSRRRESKSFAAT